MNSHRPLQYGCILLALFTCGCMAPLRISLVDPAAPPPAPSAAGAPLPLRLGVLPWINLEAGGETPKHVGLIDPFMDTPIAQTGGNFVFALHMNQQLAGRLLPHFVEVR